MMVWLSLALIFLLMLYVFWKVAKASGLLAGFSYREIRDRSVIEGQTRLTWIIVPPLWRRLLCAVSVLLLFVIWCYLAVVRPSETRGWLFFLYVPMILLLFFFDQHKPRFYRLTDEGIWIKPAGIFSDPTMSRVSERRRVRWREVQRVEFRSDRMILHQHLPGGNGCYRLPSSILRRIKRIEVPIPADDPRIQSVIERFVPI